MDAIKTARAWVHHYYPDYAVTVTDTVLNLMTAYADYSCTFFEREDKALSAKDWAAHRGHSNPPVGCLTAMKEYAAFTVLRTARGMLTGAIKAPEPVAAILEEAQKLIYGDRQESYGSVTTNFGNIAKGWEVILGKKVTPEQVGLCMAWLKIARHSNKPKRDNLIDVAGYIGCIDKLERGE